MNKFPIQTLTIFLILLIFLSGCFGSYLKTGKFKYIPLEKNNPMPYLYSYEAECDETNDLVRCEGVVKDNRVFEFGAETIFVTLECFGEDYNGEYGIISKDTSYASFKYTDEQRFVLYCSSGKAERIVISLKTNE